MKQATKLYNSETGRTKRPRKEVREIGVMPSRLLKEIKTLFFQ